MKVTVGHCEDIDSADAIGDVLDQCATDLGDLTPQAGILLAAVDHDFEVLMEAIYSRYPDLELIGCSTDGEMSSIMDFAEDSVALMLFHSDRVTFRAGVGEHVSSNPEAAVRSAVDMATDGMDEKPRMGVTMPEGWAVDGGSILKNMQSLLGNETPIFGGMSSHYEHTSYSIQVCNSHVTTDSVPILLFYGPVVFSSSVQSGWKPVGRKHRITKAEGNVIYTIDDRPVMDLLKEYFGEMTIYYPMAVFPEEDGPFFLAVPTQEMDDGGIFFFNSVPEGSVVQFADASIDEIINGAAQSTSEAVTHFPRGKPDAGLLFSCIGRRASLGTRVTEEVQLMKQQVGDTLPLLGFYTRGELCPLENQTKTYTHGQTFVTLLIGEE